MKTNKNCITISYMKNWNNNTSKRTSKKTANHYFPTQKSTAAYYSQKMLRIKHGANICKKKNQLQNILAKEFQKSLKNIRNAGLTGHTGNKIFPNRKRGFPGARHWVVPRQRPTIANHSKHRNCHLFEQG